MQLSNALQEFYHPTFLLRYNKNYSHSHIIIFDKSDI